MGASASIYVGNGTTKIIRARVSQKEKLVTKIDRGVSVEAGMGNTKAEARSKEDFEYNLDESGFAQIAPNEALAFDLSEGLWKKVYVTAYRPAAKGIPQTFMCNNYNPPRHKFLRHKVVVIRNDNTVGLSTPEELKKKGFNFKPSAASAKKKSKEQSKEQKEKEQKSLFKPTSFVCCHWTCADDPEQKAKKKESQKKTTQRGGRVGPQRSTSRRTG